MERKMSQFIELNKGRLINIQNIIEIKQGWSYNIKIGSEKIRTYVKIADNTIKTSQDAFSSIKFRRDVGTF